MATETHDLIKRPSSTTVMRSLVNFRTLLVLLFAVRTWAGCSNDLAKCESALENCGSCPGGLDACSYDLSIEKTARKELGKLLKTCESDFEKTSYQSVACYDKLAVYENFSATLSTENEECGDALDEATAALDAALTKLQVYEDVLCAPCVSTDVCEVTVDNNATLQTTCLCRDSGDCAANEYCVDLYEEGRPLCYTVADIKQDRCLGCPRGAEGCRLSGLEVMNPVATCLCTYHSDCDYRHYCLEVTPGEGKQCYGELELEYEFCKCPDQRNCDFDPSTLQFDCRCTSMDDCGTGSYCISDIGICSPGLVGDSCFAHGECHTQRCQKGNKIGSCQYCQSNSDCSSDATCTDWINYGGNKVCRQVLSCTTRDDCPSAEFDCQTWSAIYPNRVCITAEDYRGDFV